MRKVNVSMLMLLCFACAALFYLVGAQQSLSSASPMRQQDDPTNTATATASATLGAQSYFVTATLPGEPGAVGTENPNALEDQYVYPGGEGAVFSAEEVEAANEGGGRLATATPTRTPTPINVGNLVWDDIDKDGRKDAGEPGLPGVTVQIWNSAKSALYDSDVTDANGIYQLTVAGPGNYRVRAIRPSTQDSFSPKNAAGGDDLLDSDINPSGLNFGFTDIYVFASNLISITSIDIGIIIYRTPTPTRTPTPVNFGNFVWDDIDQDGRQDAGEPGLAGVTVQLWNSAKNNLIDQDTTNASGIYTLQSPGPGNYRVRVLLPSPSLDQFSPKDGAGGDDLLDSDINPTGTDFGFTDVYVIASNVISITSIDAGIIIFRTPTPTRTPTPINVGNFVWDDLNENGRQDAGEPGIEGVTVQLWNSAKSLMYGETETNASGIYTLVAPLPGNYRVRVIKPSSADDFTVKDAAGTNQDQVDSDINPTGTDAGFTDVYVFGSNLISITTIDAGIITADPITLGDSVWHDTDGDGIHEGGEPGIAGRRVRLIRPLSPPLLDLIIATDYTDANGIYRLVAPEAGTYYICVTVSAGETISPRNISDGGFLPDLRDSDVYPTATGNGRGCTADFSASGSVLTTNSYDAGISAPYASIVGQLTLEGRPAAPHASYIVPVRVRISPAGGGASIYDSYVTTDDTGGFAIGAILPGDYNIWIKHDHALANLVASTLDPGNNPIDFGVLQEGDADNDNNVNLVDFSILVSTFNKSEGTAGYDGRADFNNDNVVNLTDFSVMVGNFNQAGEPMP